VALIGEAGRKAEVRERGFGREHLFASGADAKPVDVFADAFANATSEDTRKMNGMNAGFAGQFFECEPSAMFGFQFVQDASEPKWGVPASGARRARGDRERFREKSFHGEFVRNTAGGDLAEELHAEPKERATADVFAGGIESSGAFGEPLLPRRANLDFKKPDTARTNFVLMGDAGGAKHDGERAELGILPAVAFAVMPIKKQGEEGEFVRVHRQLARSGVTQIGKDGAAMLALVVDGAEEIACAHVFSAGHSVSH
jgi:hypothetical protein